MLVGSNMTEAIIYARFSAADQAKGHTLDRQMDLAREVCEVRGLTINPSLIFTEKGKSAFTGANRKKGTLLRNLEDEIEAGAHRGRTLVVEHLDRISRQGWKEVFGFLGTCNEGGVDVATWDGSRIYPAGQEPNMGEVIEIVVKASSAQEQSDTKSYRIRKSFREKREEAEAGNSKRIASRPPSWIRRLPNGAGYELIKEHAAVVREAHRLAQIGHGTAMIAKIFNEKNVPTWRDGTLRKDGTRRVGSWHESYIARMLTMRTAIGEYVSTNHGTRILNYYPPVLTVEEYNRTQAARAKRDNLAARGRRGAAQSNIVQGIARCSHCGGQMGMKPGRRVGWVDKRPTLIGNAGAATVKTPMSYLRCNNARRRVTNAAGKLLCVNKKGIRYERLEPAILDQIMTIALDNDRYNVTEISATRSAMAENDRDLEHIKEGIANIAKSLQVAFLPSLVTTLANLEARLVEATSKAMSLSKALTREDGALPSSAFLARIKATREAMNDPDHETRRDARTMVHDSLKEVISDLLCDSDGSALIVIAHGLAAFRVTDSGKVDWHHDSSDDPQALKALTREAFEENKGLVEWIIRRAKQAQAAKR
jgi:DNA invertase Pin-like site-specific DNA recombinase